MRHLKYIFLVAGISFTLLLQAQTTKLVILHTNDTHSCIEPLPSTDEEFPDMGGVVSRKAIIDSIRATGQQVLLIDAGDFVQGTPYFNLFKGKVEAESMNQMRYDAGTLGNHEFDYGLDTLRKIIDLLDFPIVCCNYDFSNTVLKGKIPPYVILNKNGIKIGLIGAGADLTGLVQQDKYDGIRFKPTVGTVNYYADKLKKKEKCDLVICVSHIGYTSSEGTPGDVTLAQQSRSIDIIIGGHTHTYMDKPDIQKNADGKDVLIFQAGKNGVYIGKIEVELKEK